jgi:hypothetical protein
MCKENSITVNNTSVKISANYEILIQYRYIIRNLIFEINIEWIVLVTYFKRLVSFFKVFDCVLIHIVILKLKITDQTTKRSKPMCNFSDSHYDATVNIKISSPLKMTTRTRRVVISCIIKGVSN